MTEFRAIESRNPLKLCRPLAEGHKAASGYRPAHGLVQAADTAMMLGVPLLLTGEAGTGKTRAAYWLAGELDTQLLRYDVKSSSAGRDLLYSFDEVARFRDASQGHLRPLVEYVTFNALGEAILRAAGKDAVLTDLSGRRLEDGHYKQSVAALRRAFGEDFPASGAAKASDLARARSEVAVGSPEHCAVLIDELDKAPRDAPNDLLAEIENMGFALPELGVAVAAHADFKPIVLITSNSEKALPEPFLRRCAFFDIPFPNAEELAEIVDGAIAALGKGDRLVGSAIVLFRTLRASRQIRKKPGTAELLAWLEVLRNREQFPASTSLIEVLREDPARLDHSLSAVLKTGEDVAAGRTAIRQARENG